MADEDTFPLDGDGLREVVWDECDAPFAGPFVASPADAEGRGIALSVTRGGEAADLTGASLYLLWRHRELRVRGCEPLEEVDAEAGKFRVYWPAAMACAEGTVDAQVMVSWDERAQPRPRSRTARRATRATTGRRATRVTPSSTPTSPPDSWRPCAGPRATR